MKLTRVVIFKGADSHGRYGHMRFWMADYHPGHPEGEHGLRERAQAFFSPLPDGLYPVTVEVTP